MEKKHVAGALGRTPRQLENWFETNVRWILDARLTGPATFENAHVEVMTRRGRVHVGECSIALGHPDNPVSRDQRHQKFRECAMATRNPPSSTQIDDTIATIDRLEHLEDTTSLSRLLA